MKTLLLSFTSFAVVIGLVLGFIGWGVTAYVGITREQVALDQAWSRVENAFLHRQDLLPDLVTGLRRSRGADQDQVTRVVDVAEEASEFMVTPALLYDPEDLGGFLALQDEITARVEDLLADCDRPRSCGGEELAILRTQVEYCQKRVMAGRDDLDVALRRYNDRLVGFPESFVASLLGFQPMAPGEREREAEG